MPRDSTQSTPHTTHIAPPNHDERTEDLLRPLSGGYGEALLSGPHREIIRDTLMKSNAKAKSFHVAGRGNFPAARDFAEPDTYTTTRRRAGGNLTSIGIIIGIISRIINDQRVINGPPTGHPDIEPTTTPLRAIRRASHRHGAANEPPPRYERSVERVVATEPQTNRRRKRTAAAILASRQAAAGLASNEPPPRYSQAVRPPPGLRRTNRRSAAPAPRIDDTPKRRKRDDS